MIKKVFSFVLITVFCIAGLPSAMAADLQDFTKDSFSTGPTGGVMFPGEKLTREETIQTAFNYPNLTAEREQKDSEMLNMVGSKASLLYTNLGMKSFKQKAAYYCGPATAYQTIYFHNGSSPSQDTIAKALGTTTAGTDGTRIPKYVNTQLDRVEYFIYNVGTDKEGMRNAIDIDMRSGYPAMLRVKIESGTEFGYTTDGHFLNVGGQTAGATKYRIVDPYYGYKNGPKASHYNVPFDEVYTAVKTHFAHHLYY